MIEFLIATSAVMLACAGMAAVSDYLIPWLERKWQVKFK